VKHERRSAARNGASRLRLEAPASPEIVAEVRRALAVLPLPDSALEVARLLITELVTNSIRHAGLRPDDRIRVEAEMSGSRLRVDVLDGSRDPGPHRVSGAIRPTPGAESGWGLFLVDRLATRWGWGQDGYWFELEAPES
jgi:anti-sigma regulatory factor (Ser/Thr protein kinase)